MQNLQHSSLFVNKIQGSAELCFWEYMRSIILKSVDIVK